MVASGRRPRTRLSVVLPLSVIGVALSLAALAPAQDASAVRDALLDRVGDLERLRVPERLEDFPQPRLPSGELDPRFRITAEKVRLGKLLFFDPVRSNHIRPEFGGVESTSQTASCGTCHMGEKASKAGTVVSVAVGGEGRHTMDHTGAMTVSRTVRDDLVDLAPTPLEVFGEQGEIVIHGRFDAIDAPGRVAPSVIGFAFNNRLLWGGEAGEPNAEGYPAQEDVVRRASEAHRMANPDTSHLSDNPVYVRLFERAFPEEAADAAASGDIGALVSLDTQFRAIAAFLRTVITRDTPWDRFLAGDDSSMTARQLRGAWLFATPAAEGGAGCISCHSGPALNKQVGDEEGLLVDENFFNLGTDEHPLQELAREALENPGFHDPGRGGVTHLGDHVFAFKAPTLRQARDAGPYFHGGDFDTLREVVEYFNAGEPRNELAEFAGNVSTVFTEPRGPGLRGLGLGEEDVDALVDFLENALYDPGFVYAVPGSPTEMFEPDLDDLSYDEELRTLGAVDGWLPSGLPTGVNDEISRSQIVFVRGFVTADDTLDISDGVAIFDYLFRGGEAPEPMWAADANDDNRVDLADGIYLLSFLFQGGPEPPPPYPEPGQDLTK